MLRPIASGEISTSGAIYFLIILLILALICLLNLSKQPIIAFVLRTINNYLSRLQNDLQGGHKFFWASFSWGVPTAWIATGEAINIGIITIYIGTIFWVIGMILFTVVRTD